MKRFWIPAIRLGAQIHVPSGFVRNGELHETKDLAALSAAGYAFESFDGDIDAPTPMTEEQRKTVVDHANRTRRWAGEASRDALKSLRKITHLQPK